MIETTKEIKLENLLSLRKKMTMTQVQEEMLKIESHLKDNNIAKSGPVITTTFTVEQVKNEQLVDMEILIPLKDIDQLGDEYKVKRHFHLTNAIYKKHIGNPNLIQNTYNEMNSYMQINNLQPITTGYNINVKDLTQSSSTDDMEIDIYIGVNPNKL